MDQENPYISPTWQAPQEPPRSGRPARTSDGTILPRHLAAIVDNFLAIVAGVAAAKAAGDDWPILQGIVLVAVYFGYYFIFELVFSRTPGKLLTGLVIVSVEGGRCTRWQTVIRTGFRILEVNPLLFGGAPAAFFIIFSRSHQRIGDRVARTVVIPASRRSRTRTR